MNEQQIIDPVDIWAKAYPILSVPDGTGGIQHRVHITDAVMRPRDFNEIISLIQTVPDTDSILLLINSPGGYLDSTLMIMDAIATSSVPIYAQLSGTVASAATMLTLVCDDVYIAPHSTFMIHNFSGGAYGKGHEIKASIDFDHETYGKMFKDVYKHFLSKKEIGDVIAGKDLYITPEEFDVRFQKVIDKRIQKAGKIIKQNEEEQQGELVEYLKAAGYSVKKNK